MFFDHTSYFPLAPTPVETLISPEIIARIAGASALQIERDAGLLRQVLSEIPQIVPAYFLPEEVGTGTGAGNTDPAPPVTPVVIEPVVPITDVEIVAFEAPIAPAPVFAVPPARALTAQAPKWGDIDQMYKDAGLNIADIFIAGKQIAVIESGNVRVYDLETKAQLRAHTVPAPHAIYSVALLDDVLWVSCYNTNTLMRIAGDGTAQSIDVSGLKLGGGPGALCVRKGKIAVIARAPYGQPNAQAIYLFAPDGTTYTKIALSQGLDRVTRMRCDAQGRFYIQAWKWQIYSVTGEGAVILRAGTGANYGSRESAPPAAEFHNTLAVAPDGTLYGNQHKSLARIEVDQIKLNAPRLDYSVFLLTRPEFRWPEPYSDVSNLRPLIIDTDADGRVWTLSNGTEAGGTGVSNQPLLARVKENFFEVDETFSETISNLAVGAQFKLTPAAPYGIAYAPGSYAVTAEIKVAQTLPDAQLKWVSVTAEGVESNVGQTTLACAAGTPTSHEFTLDFPAFGWWQVQARLYARDGGPLLASYSVHASVTPAYPQLAEANRQMAAGEIDGSIPAIQIVGFCGSGATRIDSERDREQIDAMIAQSAIYDVPVFVQIEKRDQINVNYLSTLATRFAGKGIYYEIINEPPIQGISIEDDVNFIRLARDTIKAIDPTAKILGTAWVEMSVLNLRRFLELGGGDLIDGFSFHPYQGHHGTYMQLMRALFDQFRALFAQFNFNKPLWQTEFGTHAEADGYSRPLQQGLRLISHMEMMAENGVDWSRYYCFYPQNHGFGDYPSYYWSALGPYPLALFFRTRRALTRNKPFAEKLDFGADGNLLFVGERYSDATGEVYSLWDQGVAWSIGSETGFVPKQGARCAKTQNFGVTGASGDVTITDSYGNSRIETIAGGVLPLRLTQKPQYVQLPPGARLTPAPVDLGIDFTDFDTTAKWSGPSAGGIQWRTEQKNNLGSSEALLLDGIVGDNQDSRVWGGNFNYDPVTKFPIYPGHLEFALDEAQGVSRVTLFGTEPDDQFCQLLDYNVQVWKNNAWLTVREVRSPMPPSQRVQTYANKLVSFADSTKIHVCEFDEVQTDRVRLEVLRVTLGSHPDELVSNAVLKKYGNNDPARLCITEVQISGAQRNPITTFAAALSGTSFANAKYLKMPDATGFDFGAQSWHIALKFRVDDATGIMPLINKSDGDNGWALQMVGGQIWLSVTKAGITSRVQTFDRVQSGAWASVRFGRDAALGVNYVDFRGSRASATATAAPNSTSPLLLGFDSGNNSLRGALDKVIVTRGGAVTSRYDFENAADIGRDGAGTNHLVNVGGVTQTGGYSPA